MNDPGLDAARARVASLFERLSRVNLQVVVVAPPDATRRAALEHARDAAIVAGRRALLDEATAAAREAAFQVFARSSFSGTWAFTDMAMSVTRADDRVAAAAAFEEAATAAVAEDLVGAETLEVLRLSSDEMMSLSTMPAPGSISGFASTATGLRSTVAIAGVGAFALFLVAVGLVGASLVILALGVAIIVGLARRHPRPDG